MPNIYLKIYFGILLILFVLILYFILRNIIEAHKKFKKKEIYFVELIVPLYNYKGLFLFLFDEIKILFLFGIFWPVILIIFILLFIIDTIHR